MAGLHAEIEINRPVEAGYGFLLDLERNIVATDPMVASVVEVTERPIWPGTMYRLREPGLGQVREQTMWITAVDPSY